MKTMKLGLYSYQYTIKKSRFVTFATNVSTKQEAVDFIKKYSDLTATHNCYAYKVGVESQTASSSDNGEPQGTAGAPILNVIEKNNITNFVILVTRYFGGIELGAGPLTRAYSKAASNVINKKDIIDLVKKQLVQIEFPISEMKEVETIIHKNNWKLVNQEFKDKVIDTFTFVAPEDSPIKFINKKIKINYIKDTYSF